MGTQLATVAWAGAVAPQGTQPCPNAPQNIGGQCWSPSVPHQGWVGRERCLHLARALYPGVISDTPLLGSVGLREDGMGYEDRDGDWKWSGCQPRSQSPCPYPRDSHLSSGAITFPMPGLSQKHPRVSSQSRGTRGWVGLDTPGAAGDIGWEQPHGCNSALLTPPERFPQISQTCWNCHSSQFWHCRRIPARGSPPGSVVVMRRAGGVSLGTRHTTGHLQG